MLWPERKMHSYVHPTDCWADISHSSSEGKNVNISTPNLQRLQGTQNDERLEGKDFPFPPVAFASPFLPSVTFTFPPQDEEKTSRKKQRGNRKTLGQAICAVGGGGGGKLRVANRGGRSTCPPLSPGSQTQEGSREEEEKKDRENSYISVKFFLSGERKSYMARHGRRRNREEGEGTNVLHLPFLFFFFSVLSSFFCRDLTFSFA